MNEQQILQQVHNMCIASVEPALFEKWEEVLKALCQNRKALSLESFEEITKV